MTPRKKKRTKPKSKPKAKSQKRRVPKKKAFIAAFIETCSITEAARAVGIDRCNHYDWLRNDPKYAADFEAAVHIAAQQLEDDAVRWARKGIFVPNVYQGKFCHAWRKRVRCNLSDGTKIFEDELSDPLPKGVKVVDKEVVETEDGEILGVYERSESLLSKLLSAWMPEKYGKKVEVTGKDGEPLIPTVMEVVFVDPPSRSEAPPAGADTVETPPAV